MRRKQANSEGSGERKKGVQKEVSMSDWKSERAQPYRKRGQRVKKGKAAA